MNLTCSVPVEDLHPSSTSWTMKYKSAELSYCPCCPESLCPKVLKEVLQDGCHFIHLTDSVVSLSPEVDSALLTVIGYPAFAVEDPDIIKKTREEVIVKLGGSFGCKRFLRDGYKSPREVSSGEEK